MTLDILIPTYNRSSYLLKNLFILIGIIEKNSLYDYVTIIVSNNCSTDSTDSDIQLLSNHLGNKIIYYKQKKNIGLEENVLFLLNKATSPFVMLLGDDDYIMEEYLLSVIQHVKDIDNLACILPSFYGIDINGNILHNTGRDLNSPSALYQPGFSNVLMNSYKAHQISGIVLKRDNLYDEYRKRNVHNLYPQIFLTSLCCLKGKTYQITEYPVKVTQPNQDKKDWGYGDDGLIQDIYNNYKNLKISSYFRMLLELKLLKMQSFRYTMYFPYKIMRAFYHISFGCNTSSLGKVIIPLYLSYKISRLTFRALLRKCR